MRVDGAVCLVFIIYCLSCQTTPKPLKNVSLPIPIESQFSSCTSGQGALSVTSYDGERFLGSVELEWKDSDGRPDGWDTQILSPMGHELMRFSYVPSSQSFRSVGRLSSKFPGVSVSKGFLEVDGHFVGIKPEEISCFLNFKLPRSWLKRLTDIQQEEGRTILFFHDKYRVIRSVYSKIKPSSFCSEIRWTNYWGMVSSTLNLCFSKLESQSIKTGSVHGIEQYKVKWTDIDG